MSAAPPAALEVTVPAEAVYLKELRDLVRTFATSCGAGQERIADVVLALNEACTNVILHAYGETGGPLRLRACCTADGLALEVGDSGTPAAKPPAGRLGGLGLKLIQQVCDSVEIEGPGEYGTRLVMRFTFERS